jgi:hypothetical protein
MRALKARGIGGARPPVAFTSATTRAGDSDCRVRTIGLY